MAIGERRPVPHRDLVAPPELARDAPRLDVLEPVEIDLGVALGQDLRLAVAHGIERGAHDLRGVDEPLVGQHRLDHNLGAIAEGLHDRLVLDQRHEPRLGGAAAFLGGLALGGLGAEARVVFGHHDCQALLGDVCDHRFARLEPIEPAILVRHEVERVGLHDRNLGTFRHVLRARGGLGIGGAVGAHRALGVHKAIHRDAAALGDLVVVEVVRSGDLHRA